MGKEFTLADVNLAPFVARLDGLQLVEQWVQDKPNVQEWWQEIKDRPSYELGLVGPSSEEAETMGIEGAKVVDDFKRKRADYLSRYGSK